MDAPSPTDRRPPRIAIERTALMILDNGERVAIVLTDVSTQGFCLRSQELLEIGECVSINDSGAAPCRAEIRWVRGFEAGGVFLGTAPPLD